MHDQTVYGDSEPFGPGHSDKPEDEAESSMSNCTCTSCSYSEVFQPKEKCSVPVCEK